MMSMTAYHRQAVQESWGQAVWEIRSVNHRYLDLSFKMPEAFRECETTWRKVITQALNRGKVECALTFIPSQQTTPKIEINESLVEQLVASCQKITRFPGVGQMVNAIDILRWPQVLSVPPLSIESSKEAISKLLTTALSALQTVRQQEGQQIATTLLEKLHLIVEKVALIKDKQSASLGQYKTKLLQKIAELKQEIDPGRMEQELVFHAQRIDIQEEIDRLMSHAHEVERLLNANEPHGRRLDFLMQEMMREANTLGAKVADHQLSQASIDLKVLIEQMREQIQNLE